MFIAHGEYRVDIQQNLLIVEAKGPFNKEVVKQYALEMQHAVQKMQSPWGQLIIMHQDSLFTPEAEKLMHKSARARKLSGLYACAIVLVETTVRFAIEHQVSNIYRRADIAHDFFDCEQQARAWLQELKPQI
ncbi:MAG: hypothetical protein OFPI_17070 [Osedax symbiont Rs2]|nr:MAG: hypothetical protein OFPI_17070 [Osedax symbiont Rs2]